MKKENIILLIALVCFVCLIQYLFYPEYILQQEAGGLFLTTTDYLQKYLLAPAGMTNLLANFLTQFYRPLLFGILLQTSILMLVAIILLSYLSKWKCAFHGWLVSIPIVLFCIYQYAWSLPTLLQLGSFILLLVCYLSIRNWKIRQTGVLVIVPLLYVFLPEICLMLLFIYLMGMERFYFKQKVIPVILIISLLIVAILPLIWRYACYYMPNNQLYSFTSQTDIRYASIYYALYLFPLCPFLLLKWKEKRYLTLVIPALALMAGGYSIYASPNRYRETRLAVQRHAAEQEWDKVLQSISPQDATEPFFHPYIMLALSEKGKLTEQMFNYPLESADRIYFPADTEEGASFNSLFAHSIGLYHEAIHQLSQANAMSAKGLSFSYLRRMVDWQTEIGNTALANKYLALLKTSSNHTSWIECKENKSPNSISDIYRNDFIMDASSPLILLTQAVEADTTNRKAIDYLLCGVLLCKDLKSFYNLFQQYYPYQEILPIHYQEALLVVDLLFPELNATRTYPVTPVCRQAFEDFGALMSKRPNTEALLKQKYGNTYWYYGFIRQA